MALSLQITRGYEWTLGESITAAKLNETGKPAVVVPDGTITAASLNLPSVAAALKPSLSNINFLATGSFPPGAWSASPVAVAAGTRKPVCLGWALSAVGGGGASAQRFNDPAPASGTTGWGLRVNGSAGLTTADLIGTLDSCAANQTRNQTLCLSAWVHNLCGATLNPLLYLSTRDTPGGALTQVAGPLASAVNVPAGTWAKVYWTINTASIPNWVNGGEIAIRLNGAVVNDISAAVQFQQVTLELGAEPTAFIFTEPDWPRPQIMQADVEMAAAATPRLYGRVPLTAGPAVDIPLGYGLTFDVDGKLAIQQGTETVLVRSGTGTAVTANTTALTVVTWTPSAGDIVSGDFIEIEADILVVNNDGASRNSTIALTEGGVALLTGPVSTINAGNTALIHLSARLTYSGSLNIVTAVAQMASAASATPSTAMTPAMSSVYSSKNGVAPGALGITWVGNATSVTYTAQILNFKIKRFR